MNLAFYRGITIIIFSIIGVGCGSSTLDKQLAACSADIKEGLNDPSSLEILSSKVLDEKEGSYRISVSYTSKNTSGGRERGSATCGFASKDSTELDPNDFQNKLRQTSNLVKSLNF